MPYHTLDNFIRVQTRLGWVQVGGGDPVNPREGAKEQRITIWLGEAE